MRRAPVIVVAVSLMLAAGLVMTRPNTDRSSRPERAWAVDALTASPDLIRPTLTLFGRIESPESAEMTSAVEADVSSVVAREGDSVAAGDLIIQLDNREARLELIEREADVKDLRAQLAQTQRRIATNSAGLERQIELLDIAARNTSRAEDLSKDGVLSQSDLDASSDALKRQQLAVDQQRLALEESEFDVARLEARIDRAQAQSDRAALTLERTRVVAPFDGRVTAITVSPGDRVRPGDRLIELYNPGEIEVRTQVPSRYAAAVSTSLAAGEALPAKVVQERGAIAGTVSRIARVTQAGSGGVDAFVDVGQARESLRLGATVQVILELPAESSVIAVPSEALYGRDRIYRIVDGRLQGLTVERVGERLVDANLTDVLIRSDALQAGDQIVTTKLSIASDGLLVQVADDA